VFAAAPDVAKPDLVVNFRRALQSQTGAGFAPEMARYIYKGETIVFPDGLFGRCAEIRNARIGLFDKGFRMSTRPPPAASSPASIARVRPMRRESAKGCAALPGWAASQATRASSGPIGSADGKGKTFVVRYKPAGKQLVDVQEVVLTPRLTLAQGATSCRRSNEATADRAFSIKRRLLTHLRIGF